MIQEVKGGVTAAKGFQANGLHCGIRRNQSKPDLCLIYSETMCSAAAVYTQNIVQGAPLTVTRSHLADGKAQAVIVNSGNANTCNADGIEKATRMGEIAAEQLRIDPQDVIVASTGVIGEVLPIEPIENAATALAAGLSATGSNAAARAIMTTDTFEKEAAVAFELGGKTVHVGGIAKGSGMIHPNMATLLSFVSTDCAITADMLQKAVKTAVNQSFNCISIDGDTSTNDTFAVMANGLAGNSEISKDGADLALFQEALNAVTKKLAMMLARDGEGATKLVTCTVTHAPDAESGLKVAKSIICSSLVKTAMFGADANWGRELCAIGYAGVPLDVLKIDVRFSSAAGEIAVCKNGVGIPFSEETGKEVLSADAVTIHVNLNAGTAGAEAYGCDLTYDYVKINGDYRT